MSIINRITTWTVGQLVTSSALNGEFNNLINFLNSVDAATTAWDNVKTGALTVTGNATVGGTLSVTGAFTGSGAKVDLISTQTASNSASISFTSITNTSYNAYIIVGDSIVPATTAALLMRVSVAGVFQSGAGAYRYQICRFTGSGSATISGSGGDTAIQVTTSADGIIATGNAGCSFSLTAYNPQQTATVKRYTWMADYLGSTPLTEMASGAFLTAGSANDGFQFLMSSGNITSGNFYLYGIRNS